jgi:RNase P subunit RPR2
VSVNSVLRKIFGPKTDEVTGQWRRLHNKEFCDLCSSPLVIGVKISRRIRQMEHVARIVNRRRFW